jgi:2-oxo-4-hydroxy-4-carboxy--5-ureidoimidazoline (OHCU) decarboxylase
VTVWLGVQFSVNRQLGVLLTEHPFLGIDVMKALDDTTTDEASRCESIAQMKAHPVGPEWTAVLNREYDERHGVPFCSLATGTG